jgi:drug/metabolite transporter (DMT)-like permease
MLNLLNLRNITRFREMPLLTAVLLMLGCTALWGTGYAVNKHSLDRLPPLMLLTVELMASCAVLWAVVLWRGHAVHLNSRTLRYGLTGIFEPGLAYILMIAGLSTTTASNASILSAMLPVMVTGLAWLLLREAIPPRLMVIMSMAMFGTLMVTLSGAVGFSDTTLQGDALILVATVCASLYVLLTRNHAARMPAALLAALQQTVGLGCVLVALVLESLLNPQPAMPTIPADWLVAIFSGIMQYALAFLLYLSALRYIPATKAVLFLALIPVFGMGSAVLWLGETITPLQFIGAGLVVAALLNINLSEEDSSAEANEPEAQLEEAYCP